MLLHRFGISFVTGANHGLGDLLLATLVCANSHADFNALMGGNLEAAVRHWRWRLSGGLIGLIRRKFAKAVTPEDVLGFSFHRSCAAFEEYITAHGGTGIRANDWCAPITRQTKEGDGGNIGSPEWALLCDVLTRDFGYTAQQAWDMPIVEARWRWAVSAERKGSLSIVDAESDRSDTTEANKFAEDVAAGRVPWAVGLLPQNKSA